ncbi:MAG TPA: aminotransferase class I/II-fold pyridoxal phosphate-dependent enzyme [Bacillaceae bacterium]
MNQQRMPLYERLISHKNRNPISFHVPGHKNGALLYGYKELPVTLDATELTGLDDLHDPQGAIAEAQELLADLYGTRKSYFLVNGSTAGNLAMVMANCQPGDKVLVQRNCHKSVLNALMLANVEPLFISPEIDENSLTSTNINPELIKTAFDREPSIKACIFTYPDYYGNVYDLKSIIDIARSKGAVVLIDEAHGPHFRIGSPFPPSALDLGADMVVHSAHKTLPAMTMGSYLHVNSDRILLHKVEHYLSVLQSSSPSYPIMASLDVARRFVAHYTKNDLDYTLKKRDEFITQLTQHPNLRVYIGDDPIKIMLQHEDSSGYALQEAMEEAGVYPELADPYKVLLILPLLKDGMDFPFDRAAENISRIQPGKREHPAPMLQGYKSTRLTRLSISYPDMMDKQFEWIALQESEGRIAAKMVIPYPPGIPLLLPGETITSAHLQQIQMLRQVNARFQGETIEMKEGKVAVFIS